MPELTARARKLAVTFAEDPAHFTIAVMMRARLGANRLAVALGDAIMPSGISRII